MKMGSDRITRTICMWSQSLADENFENWAWKARRLLETIKDFGGLLSIDELWDALAQQELNQWKNTVTTIPQDSETGGRFKYHRDINSSPLNKRRVITQLHCGCLPLEIELGCYGSPKPPVSEGTCQLCE